ncbi:MAG: type II toxin-antitoxin system HicB family antitoxin [Candidatus Uhrbacteria bacterium]|nr:type II toxin-antitoxin system HicB family antitoxin [Candidatus Uhrbacteria bacterium]MDP3794114.1 type II toxin-antitoxin system HicB family antitoxin [Candidatus Uhrbacteria bacterium]
MKDHQKIQFNTEVWRENGLYVSYVPQLDLSSCGKTLAEAKANIKVATELFIEEAEALGTLSEILEEAGFSFHHGWKGPELVAVEKMQLAF